jgi:hypothetical protein
MVLSARRDDLVGSQEARNAAGVGPPYGTGGRIERMTMKKSSSLARRLAGAFAGAVLLAGLFAASAQAQSYSATFTLSHEVRWGSATLPPGEYRIAMDTVAGPLRVVDASGRVRLLLYGSKESPLKTQPASLLVTRDGAERTVRSFNCPEWNLKLVYKPFTRAEGDLVASGGQAETIAVRMAQR